MQGIQKRKPTRVLPGFGLALGFTVTYLSLLVLIPLSTLVFKTAKLGWPAFWRTVTDPEVFASYKLSFGGAAIAAAINTVFGVLVAWVLVRYRFPGRRLIDALVDLPFALPTAVAGITLATVYAPNGSVGHWLDAHHIEAAYSRIGVVIAMVFVSLPFVVRTVGPVLQDLDAEIEEAAGSLGASRWQTFARVIFPAIVPAMTTGFALAFARALGEYGSVVFISGNISMQTEITPFMIVTKLEEFNYEGATAIAVVMLVASFSLLLLINLFQWRAGRHFGQR